MENNLQCVHGDENFACMSVDSGADVHMQYFDWNGIDFFSVPTEQQRDMCLLASFVSDCVAVLACAFAIQSASSLLSKKTWMDLADFEYLVVI